MKPNLIGIARWSADTELGPAAGFHLTFEGPSGSGVQALARVPRVNPMRAPARMGGEKLECPQDLEARGAIVLQGRRAIAAGLAMTQPPRQPTDLNAATADVKARVRRVIEDLEAIEQLKEPIFRDPRRVFLDLVLSVHQLESAITRMRKAWWP
jgi:hypothetical protein